MCRRVLKCMYVFVPVISIVKNARKEGLFFTFNCVHCFIMLCFINVNPFKLLQSEKCYTNKFERHDGNFLTFNPQAVLNKCDFAVSCVLKSKGAKKNISCYF